MSADRNLRTFKNVFGGTVEIDLSEVIEFTETDYCSCDDKGSQEKSAIAVYVGDEEGRDEYILEHDINEFKAFVDMNDFVVLTARYDIEGGQECCVQKNVVRRWYINKSNDTEDFWEPSEEIFRKAGINLSANNVVAGPAGLEM